MYEQKIQDTVNDINKLKEEKKKIEDLEQRMVGRLITLQELQQEFVETSDKDE